MRHLLRFFIVLAVLGVAASAQITTAPLSGAVTDASGAVVPNAKVVVKNSATGVVYEAVSAANGIFTIPAVQAGTYAVTITAQGFKTTILHDVKVLAATPASVQATMEVGTVAESVTVDAAGEILQTQSANIATTIVGRQITELPFVSRDALDLVLLLPGTASPGRPRTSSINGLPKGALNITIDGINVQDNCLKSTDGFFTYIRPRIDAVEEVTVSTSNPGAESAGEGAAQIKFITRAGTNDYRGSAYWYHRNPALNSNYWYNNRDLPPDPRTGKAPRDRVLLNQPGFRVGGPIRIPKIFNGKDKAFFFLNYEEFRLPEQTSRNRTVLTPEGQSGIYQYSVGGQVRSVDLFALAARNTCPTANNPNAACPSTADQTVSKLLAEIRASLGKGGLSAHSDPEYQRFAFVNTGMGIRKFPTVRLDLNLSSRHRVENTWNYQDFGGTVDFLNSVDPAFPGFPNHGAQTSKRWSNSIALRSTLTPRIVNEARFGMQGGNTMFFGDVAPGQFANQGGYSLGIGAAGISTATATRSPSQRNSPVAQASDNVNWVRGAHGLNFGFSFTDVRLWNDAPIDGVVRAITFGIDVNDPAYNMFTAAANNFPSASSTQLGQARNLYATLIGRVTQVTGSLATDETTGKFVLNGHRVQRLHQRESGLFVQDTWRVRPGFTLNYGLRWEVQYPFRVLNKSYSWTSYAEAWGVSGVGNMFKPGTMTGKVPEFRPMTRDDAPVNVDWHNFAPTVGAAYSLNFKDGLLHRLFGDNGKTVLRGGFSRAYVREGTTYFTSLNGNPGGSLTATQSIANGNMPIGWLLRNGPPPRTDTLPTEPAYPIRGDLRYTANAFDPNIKTGYVHSWSFGIQRELNSTTVLEARYVGNRANNLWRNIGVNEVNLIENGFYQEFKLAQANLIANNAAGRGRTFAYFGPGTGTSPLPVLLAHFSGLAASQAGNAANYSSAYFRDSAYYQYLYPESPDAWSLGNSLRSDYADTRSLRANRLKAGLPANLWVANPDTGTNLYESSGWTSYDALQLELRRRLARGVLVQSSYAFSKSLSTSYTNGLSGGYWTWRHKELNKTVSPQDITHAFKLNWIYELPVGRGRALLGGANGFVDRVLGGWAIHGAGRLQSGTPFVFQDVDLVNMTRQEFQKMIKPRFDDGKKITYFLPQDVIDNTIKAWNPANSITGTAAPYGKPDASARYIAPNNMRNPPDQYDGQYGITNLVMKGFHLTKFDISAVKRTRITERVNVEIRAEFLNAFNNINFMVGNAGNDSTSVGGFSSASFGQFLNAYRDTSTTNDPGGRLVQLVLRINF